MFARYHGGERRDEFMEQLAPWLVIYTCNIPNTLRCGLNQVPRVSSVQKDPPVSYLYIDGLSRVLQTARENDGDRYKSRSYIKIIITPNLVLLGDKEYETFKLYRLNLLRLICHSFLIKCEMYFQDLKIKLRLLINFFFFLKKVSFKRFVNYQRNVESN